jgi:hypothetical protein
MYAIAGVPFVAKTPSFAAVVPADSACPLFGVPVADGVLASAGLPAIF